MEHLILKYLQDEITKAEIEELKAWVRKDTRNQKVLVNLIGEWSITKNDIEKSKARVLEKILSHDRSKVSHNGQKHVLWDYLLKIAAILIFGIGLSFFLWNSKSDKVTDEVVQQGIFIEKESSFGQKLTFELPDKTIVKLNAGSKLTFPKQFSKTNRQVELVGEAFFDVERDEDRPFIISSGDLDVVVLGTSFNVKSYPEDQRVEVAVKTGQVEVSNHLTDSKVVLDPKEMAIYQFEERKLSKRIIDNDIFGWTDQYLVFKDMEINEIAKIISRWYDVEVIIHGDFDIGKKFTGKYKNPSITAIMESLSYAFNFKYDINEKKISISR